jgi:hypothetical protein
MNWIQSWLGDINRTSMGGFHRIALRGCLESIKQVIFILGNREQGTPKDWVTHKKQSNPVPSPHKGRVRVGSNNS